MRFAHTDVEIAKRRDKQDCLTVFPSPYPFIACAIPAPPGFMSELTGLMLLGMPVAMLPRLRLWTQSLPELPQAILIHFHSATLDFFPYTIRDFNRVCFERIYRILGLLPFKIYPTDILLILLILSRGLSEA